MMGIDLGTGFEAISKESKPVEEEVEEAQEDSNTPEGDEDDSDMAIHLDDEEDDEADEPESDLEETNEDESDEDDGNAEEALTYVFDGEEHTLSAKEVHELRKDAGRSKALTQKEQAIAEERKQLDAEEQAIRWAKQKPEVKAKQSMIDEALQAVNRGFHFGRNGQQIRLTQSEINDTMANVRKAQSDLANLAPPPRMKELQEVHPDLFSQDVATSAKALHPYREVLGKAGFSQAEVTALDDPRIFFMVDELLANSDVASRVQKQKQSRKSKDGIVKRPTKAKGSHPNSSKSKRPKKTDAQLIKEIDNDHNKNYGMLFDDIEF